MKGNRNGEESLSFGKLQTNSRADALPGPLYSSPGQDQVTERRGGGDGDVPGLCWGSSGQCGDTLSQTGGCRPPLFINMFSTQIYSAGRRSYCCLQTRTSTSDG